MGYVLTHVPSSAADRALLERLRNAKPGEIVRVPRSVSVPFEFIDPHRLDEAEEAARSLGVMPPRVHSDDAPEGWTEGDEACYQYYLRGFYSR